MPRKGICLWINHIYCGDQNQSLALQNSSLKVNVSGCRMLQRCLSLLKYGAYLPVLMESSQQWQMSQAHLDFFCSRFLAFRCSQPWGLPCLGLGFWSHVLSQDVQAWQWRCLWCLCVCVLPCEDIQLVQIPYRWLHLSFFSHLFPTCQARVSRFHDTLLRFLHTWWDHSKNIIHTYLFGGFLQENGTRKPWVSICFNPKTVYGWFGVPLVPPWLGKFPCFFLPQEPVRFPDGAFQPRPRWDPFFMGVLWEKMMITLW